MTRRAVLQRRQADRTIDVRKFVEMIPDDADRLALALYAYSRLTSASQLAFRAMAGVDDART
jgi:hypothetical protein